MAVTEEPPGVAYTSARIDEVTAGRKRLLPLLAPWLRPAAWAPRTDRVPLGLAFLMHLLAGIGVLIICLSIDPFSEWLRSDEYGMLHLMGESVLRLAKVFERHTSEALLITAGTVAVVEIGCVLLALMMMPWGAVDEPVRASFAHALRRVWLHTTQAAPMFVLAGIPITYMEHLRWLFMRSMQWRGPWETWPWWVRNDEVIIGYFGVVMPLWFVWGLFRAAGVARSGSAPTRPPTCEYCGYNLTGTPIGGRCPECGIPAISSLGPHVRTGTAYDRAAAGGFAAMRQCWLEAILSPTAIGRQMQVNSPSRKHRRCLTATLVPAFVVSTIGFFLTVFAAERGSLDAHQMVEILSVVPIVAVCVPAGVVLLAVLMVSVVGAFLSIRDKRNLLPAAVQMQCYLGGFLLLWQAFGWIWARITISLGNARLFWDLQGALRVDHEFLAFLFWFLPSTGLLLLDAVLLWKGTSAARYANR